MHLVKLLTTLTLLVSLTAAEDTTAIESQAAQPSSASASPSGFGAVLQHPIESLLRIVPHGEFIWPLGSKHQDVQESVTMKNVSEVVGTDMVKTHIVELLLPPAIDKQGVHVHLDGDVITVIGGYVKHVESTNGGSQDTFVETRRFAKKIHLPYTLKPEDIKAKLEDGGVLKLEIKREEQKRPSEAIEVE